MPRYFCDYCQTYLTHDSAPGRKQHNRGWKHRENVKTYYEAYMPGGGGGGPPSGPYGPGPSQSIGQGSFAPRPPMMGGGPPGYGPPGGGYGGPFPPRPGLFPPGAPGPGGYMPPGPPGGGYGGRPPMMGQGPPPGYGQPPPR